MKERGKGSLLQTIKLQECRRAFTSTRILPGGGDQKISIKFYRMMEIYGILALSGLGAFDRTTKQAFLTLKSGSLAGISHRMVTRIRSHLWHTERPEET